eukprot:7378705-Prymnesium_polylepis.1
MEEGGDAPTAKPNPVTVQDVEEMNRATRFIASCDGCAAPPDLLPLPSPSPDALFPLSLYTRQPHS